MKDWIIIYDNSQDARIVYTSESITDHLGWEPEDLIGKAGYEIYHPDDHRNIRRLHVTNVYNEKMSSMLSYRAQKKDGTYVYIETIVHYCYDHLVTTNFLYIPDSHDHKMRSNTADEVFHCLSDGTIQLAGAWNEKQENMKRSLDLEKVWKNSKVVLTQERRFALILNRYTDALTIVYVTSLAKELVALDIDNAIGASLFQYVKETDAVSLQSQIYLAREHEMIVRVRFDWMTDHEKGHSEPVEGIVSCTDDGLVMVCRLSPRQFVKQ